MSSCYVCIFTTAAFNMLYFWLHNRQMHDSDVDALSQKCFLFVYCFCILQFNTSPTTEQETKNLTLSNSRSKNSMVHRVHMADIVKKREREKINNRKMKMNNIFNRPFDCVFDMLHYCVCLNRLWLRGLRQSSSGTESSHSSEVQRRPGSNGQSKNFYQTAWVKSPQPQPLSLTSLLSSVSSSSLSSWLSVSVLLLAELQDKLSAPTMEYKISLGSLSVEIINPRSSSSLAPTPSSL